MSKYLKAYDYDVLMHKKERLEKQLDKVENMLHIEDFASSVAMPERLRIWFLQQQPVCEDRYVDNQRITKLKIGETVLIITTTDGTQYSTLLSTLDDDPQLHQFFSDLVLFDWNDLVSSYRDHNRFGLIVNALLSIYDGDASSCDEQCMSEIEDAWNVLTHALKPSVAICFVYASIFWT